MLRILLQSWYSNHLIAFIKINAVHKRDIYTFDGDKAGKVAAWRALENSLGILREDIRIKFIFLDDGHDPDSFINENGKDAFLALRDNAISLSEFFLNDLKSRDDLSTIEGRSNVAKISLSYINKIKNQTIKEAYISEISKICDLDLSNLISISAKNTNAPAVDVNEKKYRVTKFGDEKSNSWHICSTNQKPNFG